MNLSKIKIMYRHPKTGNLWGVTTADNGLPEKEQGWVLLGSPTVQVHYTKHEMMEIEHWLTVHAPKIPYANGEYSIL